MTRSEFVDKWLPEAVGLLMKSFHEASAAMPSPNFNSHKEGREMIQQMKRAKDMLGRMFDDLPKTDSS